jgi:hypothetical protein
VGFKGSRVQGFGVSVSVSRAARAVRAAGAAAALSRGGRRGAAGGRPHHSRAREPFDQVLALARWTRRRAPGVHVGLELPVTVAALIFEDRHAKILTHSLCGRCSVSRCRPVHGACGALALPPSLKLRRTSRARTRRRHDDNDETLVSHFAGLLPRCRRRASLLQHRPRGAPGAPGGRRRRQRGGAVDISEGEPSKEMPGVADVAGCSTSLSSCRRLVVRPKAASAVRRRGHECSVTANSARI